MIRTLSTGVATHGRSGHPSSHQESLASELAWSSRCNFRHLMFGDNPESAPSDQDLGRWPVLSLSAIVGRVAVPWRGALGTHEFTEPEIVSVMVSPNRVQHTCCRAVPPKFAVTLPPRRSPCLDEAGDLRWNRLRPDGTLGGSTSAVFPQGQVNFPNRRGERHTDNWSRHYRLRSHTSPDVRRS